MATGLRHTTYAVERQHRAGQRFESLARGMTRMEADTSIERMTSRARSPESRFNGGVHAVRIVREKDGRVMDQVDLDKVSRAARAVAA